MSRVRLSSEARNKNIVSKRSVKISRDGRCGNALHGTFETGFQMSRNNEMALDDAKCTARAK